MHSLTKNPARFAWTVASLLALAALAFAPASGRANFILIDPSTLQIGPQLGSSLDPVQIGNTGQVTVSNVATGANDLNTPWLLILGIPNVTSTSAQITLVNGSSTTINPNTNPTTVTMISGQEAYTQLSLVGANNSNSFTNWSAADLAVNAITATSFGLFEYNIPVTLTGGGTDTFQFANLPIGTFVIAYGLQGAAETNPNPYDTPFTEAGLETGQNRVVPAPSSVILLGVGGLGLVGFMAFPRRRRAKAAA
jgi:hypothetical protein